MLAMAVGRMVASPVSRSAAVIVPLAEAMPSSFTAPLFTPPNTVVSFAPLIAKLTVVEAEPPLPSETVIEKLSVTLLLSPWMAALLGV